MIQGSTASTATMSSTLSGTMNGENTPTAISFASGGMCSLIGKAMKSIRRSGPGQQARTTTAISTPAALYSSRLRSSMRCSTKGCSVPASSSSLEGDSDMVQKEKNKARRGGPARRSQRGLCGLKRATRAAPDCTLVRIPDRALYHWGTAARLRRQFLRTRR